MPFDKEKIDTSCEEAFVKTGASTTATLFTNTNQRGCL